MAPICYISFEYEPPVKGDLKKYFGYNVIIVETDKNKAILKSKVSNIKEARMMKSKAENIAGIKSVQMMYQR